MTDSAFGLLVDDESQQASKLASERRLSAPQRSYDSAPHIAKDPKGFFTDPRNIMSALIAAGVATAPQGNNSNNLNRALTAGLAGLGTRGNIENTLEANRNDERTRLLDEQAQIDKAEQDRLQTQAAMDNTAFGYAQYMGNMHANLKDSEFKAQAARDSARAAATLKEDSYFKDFLTYAQMERNSEADNRLPPKSLADLQADFEAVSVRLQQQRDGEMFLARKPDGSGMTYASRELVPEDDASVAEIPNKPLIKSRKISNTPETKTVNPYARPPSGFVQIGRSVAGAEENRRSKVTSGEVAKLAPLAVMLAKRYDMSKGITKQDDAILQRIYRGSTNKEARDRAFHAAGFSVQDIAGFNRSYGVGNVE